MRRLATWTGAGAAVVAATVVTGGLVLPSASVAADGTGVYGAWTASSVGFTGTEFPSGTVTSTRTVTPAGGTSIWLGPTTPVGTAYGSSQGRSYLTVPAGTVSEGSVTTVTFATPPQAGTWSLVLGDVDAEDVTITATGSSGSSVATDSWYRSSFNLCSVSPKPSGCPAGTHTDVPTWLPASATLKGSGVDTNGATAWFTPTSPVTSLTLTARVTTGLPVFQVWIVADVIVEPTPTSSPTSTPTGSASPSPTGTPTGEPTSTETPTAGPTSAEPADGGSVPEPRPEPSATQPSPVSSPTLVPQVAEISVQRPAPGVVVFPQVRTSAGQRATIRVRCQPLMRMADAGDMRICDVQRTRAAVTVRGLAPVRVTATATAPAKGRYAALRASRTVLLR